MKKTLSLLSVGILTCLSVMAAINWTGGAIQNLAKEAKVTVSSKSSDAANITDDNDGTDWQAVAATHNYTHDWVLIDLGEEKTITDIEIIWEASHCKNYSVYVTNDEISVTDGETEDENPIAYKSIDANWIKEHQPAATSGNETEAGYTDNITFSEPQTGRYVLIYANEYNNFGANYGMRIFEVRMADISNRNEVSGLQMNVEGNIVANGEGATVSVVPVNKVGETLSLDDVTNLQLTCNDEAVTIADMGNGTFSVTATKFGTYTLTANATANGNTISSTKEINVAYNWNGIENLATGKDIKCRVKTSDDAAAENAVATNANDGDMETFYQYNGMWSGGDGWLLVDLGDVYDVSAIGAYYSDNAAGSCIFGYSTDATKIIDFIQSNGADFAWKNNAELDEGWTLSAAVTRTANAITTQAYSTPAIARYIVIKDNDNPTERPCINEIYVAGTLHEASKAQTIELSLEKGGLVIGETNSLTVSVLDQYGQTFATDIDIKVEGADYNDGIITTNAKGLVTVTATAGEISKTESFFVADENDYCLAGATFTASENAADNFTSITDGGQNISDWGQDYVLAPNAPAGPANHWILVKLAKPYNIDMIAALWEGASPAQYNVYVGETAESLHLLYSQSHPGMENYSDRFSGKEMNNIQYIKIESTANATEYGVKLHDLKIYGTSSVASEASSIELTASTNYAIANEDITLNAKVLDQFNAEMPDAQITYTCDNVNATIEGNTFKASALDNYTVIATCGGVKAEVGINVVATTLIPALENIKNTETLNGEPIASDLFNNLEVQTAIAPATLVINFDRPQNFDLLNIRWEASCASDYTVEATYSDGTKATVFTLSGREFVNGINPVDRIADNLKNLRALTFNIKAKAHSEYSLRLLGIDAYTAQAEQVTYPTTNSYVRIMNENHHFMTSGDNTEDENNASSVWELRTDANVSAGVFKLYNLNSQTETGTFALTTTGNDNEFTLTDVGGENWTQLNGAWMFSEANTITIRLNKANAADTDSYASIYLPFNVTVPAESGVTAYKGSINDDKTQFLLNAVEGVIPAENGIILHGDNVEEVTLNITKDEANADMSDNALTGTLVEKDLTNENHSYYYVLGASNNQAGMYHPSASMNAISQNKAYVYETKVGAQGLRFSFGDTTGIGHINTTGQQDENTYYDLSGRRVQNPKKGIYVVGNRKVILK